MTTLLEFLGSPLAHGLLHALGWTLLHFFWQGAIVAAVLWCALQLLAGRSSQVRYLASCLAFLALVTLPLITFARLAAAAVKSGEATWNPSIAIDPTIAFPANAGAIVAPWPARVAFVLDHHMPWLLAVWLAGAIFFLARLNYGLFVAGRLKSSGTRTPDAAISAMFEDMKQRLGIDRVVRLLHSARVQVPTVIGWLRPVVLIPASCLTGLSAEQIEAIFCHELAHVRRHDYLVSVFQSIAEALLFYHPAVWWISSQMRRERECCCDEIAVDNGNDVLAYAKALSYLEERRATFPEFVLGANGGVLSMRIKRLLGYQTNAPSSQFAASTFLVLMLTAAGSYVATTARAQAKPIEASKPVGSMIRVPLHAAGRAQLQTAVPDANERPLQAEYKKWLEQDVLYIIRPADRAVFLRLKNDDERDKFIEQFWAHRDPPGVAPGTFREEHYARIAYSNTHFAANKPGWMTDRGRIYILYGKPNSIDSHPSGSAGSPPFEIWHYGSHAIGKQADVEFQMQGDGDYRIVIPNTNSAPSQGPLTGASVSPAPGNAPPMASGVPSEYNGEPLRRIGGAVSPPVVIYNVEPTYSEQARQAKFMGVVLLNLIVDAKGLPQNVHVVRGVGMGLDEKAVEAVRQYKFRPARENGKPVPATLNVEVNFQIFDKPKSPQPSPTVSTAAVGPGGVTMPVIAYQVFPEFTEAARKAKKSGTVLVGLTVDERGVPKNVHVTRGLDTGLDKKAVEAVRQYRFKPATKDNQPVAVPLTVEVNFQIF